MTKIEPGTYVLACDVNNPRHLRSHKHDWRHAEKVFKAGTRFTAVKERWHHFEAIDSAALERFAARWGEDMIERATGWAWQLVLKRQDARDMYDVGQIDHAYTENDVWTLITSNLKHVEDTFDDIMDRVRLESHVTGYDMIATLVRNGKLTLDDVRALAAEAEAWSAAHSED